MCHESLLLRETQALNFRSNKFTPDNFDYGIKKKKKKKKNPPSKKPPKKTTALGEQLKIWNSLLPPLTPSSPITIHLQQN